jgi:hypothetical protein
MAEVVLRILSLKVIVGNFNVVFVFLSCYLGSIVWIHLCQSIGVQTPRVMSSVVARMLATKRDSRSRMEPRTFLPLQ